MFNLSLSQESICRLLGDNPPLPNKHAKPVMCQALTFSFSPPPLLLQRDDRLFMVRAL